MSTTRMPWYEALSVLKTSTFLPQDSIGYTLVSKGLSDASPFCRPRAPWVRHSSAA